MVLIIVHLVVKSRAWKPYQNDYSE